MPAKVHHSLTKYINLHLNLGFLKSLNHQVSNLAKLWTEIEKFKVGAQHLYSSENCKFSSSACLFSGVLVFLCCVPMH